MGLKTYIDNTRIPQHIAVIMDGNGRWAKQQGMERIFGHRHGIQAVRDVTEACAELGVGWLTLYAFSTENWNRPQEEVNALMALLVDTIEQETPTLNKNNVRLLTIGDTQRLPEPTRKKFEACIQQTAQNTGLNLVLALSYSSRWELTETMRTLAQQIQSGELSPSDISETLITQNLDTHGIPDPDLLIRTSGELRISNFLLWQLAYAELYFTDCCWPDFNKEELYRAIINYQQRERRFGKTSEQIHTVHP
ncbi:MAG: isoprenyl transferase [Paludibacter sp.]|nr:isoprenyl transferase [Bacteroidales bacterium]MCM1069756.1 isoprenyl transferase [Prevotella sp.]MCM1354441.1 isoprenyl transferase [Bacteroides sp.]MCM1443221.1 isoprenyl transferase [Muribaculum sp.]MCM1482475.1 isoprenyl transferase [Paludibacter sp.]